MIRQLEYLITLCRYVNDDNIDVDFDESEQRMSFEEMKQKLENYKVPSDILLKHPEI